LKNGIKTLAIWGILLVILIFVVPSILDNAMGKIDYSEMISQVRAGNIEEIRIGYSKESATVKFKDTGKTTNVNIPDIENLMENLNNNMSNNQVKVIQEDEPFMSIVLDMVYKIAIFGMLIMLFFLLVGGPKGSGSSSGTLGFGKSRAKQINGNTKTKVTFEDVAGIDEEREELEEIVDFLKNPKKYTDMGARIPKGVLLVGQPGTGKTLLAKAVAGEAGVPFFFISGSDFVEMFVGVGASRVRDLFEEAKKNAPSIIFIDEIDAVGRQRGAGLGGGHDEREQTLNQMLVEMDGFAKNEGVVVLAATNRPDILDKALLRPGRFDRQIMVSPPDVKAREQILNVHAKQKKFDDTVDLKLIAKNTSGFVGADLENLLNEAALLAARHNEPAISEKDIENAMVKITMGPEKTTRVRTDKDKRLVSYHEGGHAVVSHYLPSQDPVHEISIIPRGQAGGYTMYRPTEDKNFISRTEMYENIVSLLGGRVAEELVIGDISTGASNDIERATKIAKSMVTKYGMSDKVGTITFGSESEEVFIGRDWGQEKTYSEGTAAIIDAEIKKIIDSAYEQARNILNDHRDKLDAVAAVLIEKEKITGQEFDQIFGDGIKTEEM
jgi:cell division protease FtsH